ncbi:MAG: hypothetical protein M8865_11405 [marine benthic group bacterium]|nr:hypothetical protein [Gemmatimonadota bacterium]
MVDEILIAVEQSFAANRKAAELQARFHDHRTKSDQPLASLALLESNASVRKVMAELEKLEHLKRTSGNWPAASEN